MVTALFIILGIANMIVGALNGYTFVISGKIHVAIIGALNIVFGCLFFVMAATPN